MAGSILKALQTSPTPLVDQNTATFVWKGKAAPCIVGDITGWDGGTPVKMEKSAPGVWTYQVPLPADAYIEYAFQDEDENLLDPLNPRVTSNGVGGYNNYFSMPEYRPTDLAKNQRKVSHGTVSTEKISVEYLLPGKNRLVHFYQPPVSRPVPLLVVWDGQDYLYRLRLNLVLDNLIAQKRIQPLALALIENGGQKSRMVEYACSEATLVFLKLQVLPLASKVLNLVDIESNPGAFGTLGASMGGLMALYAGMRFPNIFSNVLSQSGAFSFAGFDSVVFDLLDKPEKFPLNIWMDVGLYDLYGLLESNHHMKSELEKKGYTFTYREFPAGHNYPSWRDDLWHGLEQLYGVNRQHIGQAAE